MSRTTERNYFHIPVLANEVIELLNLPKGGIVVDATIGEGGHAEKLLERTAVSHLIGIEIDPELAKIAKERLKRFDERVIIINGNFADIEKILFDAGADKVDGILFDLGVSMYHYKGSDKGFSFESESRIDMRLNGKGISAYDVVNKTPQSELAKIIKEYGEDPFYHRIARAIVKARKIKPIETARELAGIILKAMPDKIRKRRNRIHPATRTFQAIRIAVNDELNNLRKALPQAVGCLKKGGRICVITFHSLEDRIVKNFFREMERSGNLKVLTKKPITATSEEVRANPPSRSAKLRCAEVVEETRPQRLK